MPPWLKVVLIVALLLASQLAPAIPAVERWDVLTYRFVTVGLVAFGIVNVLLRGPGTYGITTTAIGAAFVGLFASGTIRVLIALVAWLLWPPAFLVARHLARARHEGGTAGAGTDARIAVAVIIVAIALASVAYRIFVGSGLAQTAALFVGIPTIVALVVVFGVSPRSALGVANKAVTVGLLVSLILLGEGLLCVMMSAPLFYLVASAVAVSIDRTRARRHTPLSLAVLLLVLPWSLEGVTDLTSFDRHELVSVTRTVAASSGEVARALTTPPRFERALPPLLRIGFPRPMASRLEQTTTGARWFVTMRGGEMRLDGMEPRAGDLVLDLVESVPGRMHWRAVKDDSHMTHFLAWQDITVSWRALNPATTEVTWHVTYRRGLDPAWYFGPLQRYAAGLAAGYLIAAVATP